MEPRHSFIKAHFYAPHKLVFGIPVDTFWVNIGVIWFYNLMLYITLHFRVLRKAVEYIPKLKLLNENRGDKAE
jgi:hypothetical protein